jgi:hypothetical protein
MDGADILIQELTPGFPRSDGSDPSFALMIATGRPRR